MDRARDRLKRRRPFCLNLLLVLVLLLLVAALVVLVLVTRRPPFYVRADQRNPARLVADAGDFNRQVQHFYSGQSSGRGFTIELTEDQVNGYLAAANDDALYGRLTMRLDEQREAFRTEALRNVQVAFRDGRITLAGETTAVGLTVVVSMTGTLELADGQVRIRVERIDAGALPLAKSFFREFLGRVDGRAYPEDTRRWRVEEVELRDRRLVLRVESVRR